MTQREAVKQAETVQVLFPPGVYQNRGCVGRTIILGLGHH